jgi:hypothetical protein
MGHLQRFAFVFLRRCNRCKRPLRGTTANDGACACGGLIEANTCEETTGMIGDTYIRCERPATTLVQHRGRTEGPYWMCATCASHNLENRDAEDITP